MINESEVPALQGVCDSILNAACDRMIELRNNPDLNEDGDDVLRKLDNFNIEAFKKELHVYAADCQTRSIGTYQEFIDELEEFKKRVFGTGKYKDRIK